MTQVVGFIKEIKVRKGTNSKGKAWTGYTLVIEGKDGEQLGFHSFGFAPPPAKEGDYVQFENSTNSKGYSDIVEGSLKVATQPPKRGGAAAAAEASAPEGTTPDTRQAIIGYQNARTAAIQLVGILSESKGLPISAAATKAGDAKRYEEIVAIVNKLTVQFFADAATLRLLDSVQDAGEVIDIEGGEEVSADEADVADMSDLEDPGFK